MKKIVAAFILLAGVLFGANLDWPSDYQVALQQAKQEKKNIYMLITSQDCRWCRKFEETTLQEDIVRAKLQKEYVLVHLDRDLHVFPQKFQRAPVPRHYFITPDEEVIYTFLGYWDREDFFSYLKDAQERLKKMQNN